MPVLLCMGVVIFLGMAAALAAQHRTLRELAMRDPLTGAFNRRQMDFCLANAIERLERTGEPASLLMFDVDHFKSVNDSLGHAAGDEVLKRLVTLVSGRARKLDVLFRIGGEEFLLLLPGASYDGALAVAENLCRMVAASDLLDGWRLSISIGVSELLHAQSAPEWIEDADVALYRAKRSGRNRVGFSARAAATAVAEPAHH